jgi:signal transduction histidine kinase/CheY-like chemotaxis protein
MVDHASKGWRLPFRTVRGRLILLVGVCAAGLVVCGILAQRTLCVVGPEGPYFRTIVQGKDLIAEIRPSPGYLAEAYLLAYQINDPSRGAAIADLVSGLDRLHEDYLRRHEYWSGELPPGKLRGAMVVDSYAPAQRFWEIVDDQFLPAVRAGQTARAAEFLGGPLRECYEEHRRAIHESVALAGEQNRRDEMAARMATERLTRLVVAVGLAIVASAILIGRRISVGISRPLAGAVDVLESVASGDLSRRAAVLGDDDLGRMAAALNAATDASARALRDLEESNRALAKAMGDAQAASRAKTEFLANMSHEIRTPMTAILGYTDVLREECWGRQRSLEAIDVIRRSGDHLLEIINDILDISRIEANRIEIESVPVKPVHLIADVCSLMRVRSAAKGLTLEIAFRGSVPETIRSDPTRLRQVLMNLIGNAVKFTERGGVELRVELDESDGACPRLAFEVADTGVGIAPERIPQLFQPFSQADTSLSRRYGGTGLGLAISQRLVRLMGGDIDVQSTPGRGTTFRFSIPTGKLDGVARIVPQAGSSCLAGGAADAVRGDPPSGFPACRILLAEDTPENQRLIEHVLRRAGATVAVVENGELAVDAALAARERGEPFDLVVMDMQMPVLDGYSATRVLRQKGYDLPIVALTAHAMQGDRELCLSAGCDDYATKPIQRESLLALLARYVNRREGAPAAS